MKSIKEYKSLSDYITDRHSIEDDKLVEQDFLAIKELEIAGFSFLELKGLLSPQQFQAIESKILLDHKVKHKVLNQVGFFVARSSFSEKGRMVLENALFEDPDLLHKYAYMHLEELGKVISKPSAAKLEGYIASQLGAHIDEYNDFIIMSTIFSDEFFAKLCQWFAETPNRDIIMSTDLGGDGGNLDSRYKAIMSPLSSAKQAIFLDALVNFSAFLKDVLTMPSFIVDAAMPTILKRLASMYLVRLSTIVPKLSLKPNQVPCEDVNIVIAEHAAKYHVKEMQDSIAFNFRSEIFGSMNIWQ